MPKNFDSYYDPPDDESPCQICHSFECECPECEICGEAGNPACINTHMTWEKWGHFNFAPNKEERKRAALEMEAEAEFEKAEKDLDTLPEDQEIYQDTDPDHGPWKP